MMPEGFEPRREFSIFNPETGEEYGRVKGTASISGLTEEELLNKNPYYKGLQGEISMTASFKDAWDEMQDNDVVNHPNHYTQSDVEVIDAIEAITSRYPAPIRYHLGNVIKYVCRAPFKNGVEDLQKGLWYLERSRRNPIVQAELVTHSIYTVDIETFMLDSALGYEKDTYPYVISILNRLAEDKSVGDPVGVVLSDVAHDLKCLIKVLEKSTK